MNVFRTFCLSGHVNLTTKSLLIMILSIDGPARSAILHSPASSHHPHQLGLAPEPARTGLGSCVLMTGAFTLRLPIALIWPFLGA